MAESARNSSEQSVGRKVVERLEGDQIEPTPGHYELLYRYLTKSDSSVVELIEEVIARKGKLDNNTLDQIRRHVFGAHEADDISDILDGSHEQLQSVAKYIDAAGGYAKSYGQALQDGRLILQSDPDATTQAGLVQQLMAATNAMLEKTSKLESQLAMSSKEINSLRSELDKARSESRTDPLTGLPNRKALQAYLEAQAARATADRRPLTLIFCDIDHFKKFNDTWGHRMGDEILRLVGKSLEQLSMTIGYPCRYGGEEFVIVLPGKDLENAVDIAEQFRDFVGTRTVKSRSSNKTVGQVTLSLGIAQMRWSDSLDTLVERADAALYKAKQTGRNKVCTEKDLEAGQTTVEAGAQ